jgi:hypothetical protein
MREMPVGPKDTHNLPARLQRALARELYLGEEVEFIAQPRSARLVRLWRGLALVCLVAAGLVLAGRLLWGWELATFFLCLEGATGCALMPVLGRHQACVVTDRRCFVIEAIAGRVSARELDQVPEHSGLDAKDLAAVKVGLKRLSHRAAFSGDRNALDAPVGEQLPAALRARVEQALEPDERVFWAGRPGVGEYLCRAPAGPEAMLLVISAAVASVVAAISLYVAVRASVAELPREFTVTLLVLMGPTAVALWTLSTLHLRRQICETVYLLTNRRGLVIAPGGRILGCSYDEMKDLCRTENAAGRGSIRITKTWGGVGFYGIANVAAVEDLIKGRTVRERSLELAPAEAPDGRGDEVSAAGT